MRDTPARPAILIVGCFRTKPCKPQETGLRWTWTRADTPLSKEEFHARLKRWEGLICLITDVIDDELLASCPEVRGVANVAVGFNNVDVASATRRGVVITKTMKRTAYLVNAARGPLVDEVALVQALRESGSPVQASTSSRRSLRCGLLGLPNVVLAPHIASASYGTRLKMASLAVENCLAVLEGRMPPTPVNPEALSARAS
jgi:lactate dehydrogenase-like 2-hydroxyacid dehydrogenase